jgi:hypothetical protein
MNCRHTTARRTSSNARYHTYTEADPRQDTHIRTSPRWLLCSVPVGQALLFVSSRAWDERPRYLALVFATNRAPAARLLSRVAGVWGCVRQSFPGNRLNHPDHNFQTLWKPPSLPGPRESKGPASGGCLAQLRRSPAVTSDYTPRGNCIPVNRAGNTAWSPFLAASSSEFLPVPHPLWAIRDQTNMPRPSALCSLPVLLHQLSQTR